MNSHPADDNHQIVSDYFRLIHEKDIHGLLTMFTDDCVIYEPFSKGPSLYYDNRVAKSCMKGQYDIEFIDEPMDISYELSNDNFGSMPSSTISVLASFYNYEGGEDLKERLTFHIVSKKNYDSVTTMDSGYNNINDKKIKTLWIQFCSHETSN